MSLSGRKQLQWYWHWGMLFLLCRSYSGGVAAQTTNYLYDRIATESDLKTLTAAFAAAEFDSVLGAPKDPANPIQYTLFAPNDAALSSLDAKYLTENWRLHLKSILNFHVTASVIMAADIKDGMQVTTLVSSEPPLLINVSTTSVVTISGPSPFVSTVVATDFMADNGVFHKVDTLFWPVLMTTSLLDLATSDLAPATVGDVLAASGLQDVLDKDDLTIFAPSDQAFAAFNATNDLATILADQTAVQAILSYHMVPGVYPSFLLTNGTQLVTLSNHTLIITTTGVGRFADKLVNGWNNTARISLSDGLAGNGLGFFVDTVLIPPPASTEPPPPPATPPVSNDTNTTTTPGNYLSDRIATETDLKTLTAAFAAAEFDTVLGAPKDPANPTTNYTLFAPIDTALSTLDAKYLTENWRLHLKAILNYHVTPGIVMATDLMNGMELTTLVSSEAPLLINVTNAVVTVSGPSPFVSTIVATDFMADNGVFHKVDTLFWPVLMTTSLLDLATSDLAPATVGDVLAASGLEDILDKDDLTIFAPSDQAFQAFNETNNLAVILADQDAVRAILSYHMVPGVYPSFLLTNGTQLTTLSNFTLIITTTGVGRFADKMVNGWNNTARISLSDGLAGNGLGFFVDTVLIPPPASTEPPPPVAPPPSGNYLYDRVATETDLTTLTTALKAAGFDIILGAPPDATVAANYTLFAPIDTALTTLDAKYLTDNWRLHLRAILNYHVTSGVILAADLVDGMELATLASSEPPLLINVTTTTENASVVTISGPSPFVSTVVATDLMADNGVFHKVDTLFWPVLMTTSLLDLATSDLAPATVGEVLAASGLQDILEKDDLTIFAPSDQAFSAFNATNDLSAILADQDAVRAILSYHMVPGVYPSFLLINGTELTTLSNFTLIITTTGAGRFADKFVNGWNNTARISLSDGLAGNGLGFFVDTVLIPPEGSPTPSCRFEELKDFQCTIDDFCNMMMAQDKDLASCQGGGDVNGTWYLNYTEMERCYANETDQVEFSLMGNNTTTVSESGYCAISSELLNFTNGSVLSFSQKVIGITQPEPARGVLGIHSTVSPCNASISNLKYYYGRFFCLDPCSIYLVNETTCNTVCTTCPDGSVTFDCSNINPTLVGECGANGDSAFVSAMVASWKGASKSSPAPTVPPITNTSPTAAPVAPVAAPPTLQPTIPISPTPKSPPVATPDSKAAANTNHPPGIIVWVTLVVTSLVILFGKV